MMNELGINTQWKVIRGDNSFFNVTKTFHNSLQNGVGELLDDSFKIYEKWQGINLSEIPLDYDVVFIHDPQPAGLIKGKKKGKWVWRCHIDISNPYPPVWNFLRKYVQLYDSMIISSSVFGREDLNVPQFVIPPSIDPLSVKNREISSFTVERILRKFEIDTERPLITQISRFDRAKDPVGVIQSFKA